MTTILIKKRDTAGAPTAGDLTNAAGGVEIAVNTATKRIYSKDSGGNIIELGTNATSSTIDQLTVTTSTTLSYGTANQVQFLNGSKQLVGDADLTFDGTALSATRLVSTQVNITGQGDLRLEDTTGGEYVALQAPTSLASSYTLTLPIDDGVSGQALITDGSGNLSWSTSASGDVYGPASSTANGIALFDGTTGKLLKDSASTDGLIHGLTVGTGAGSAASNTVVGNGSLSANTSGVANTAIGASVLQANTNGNNNTAVGYLSEYSNTAGVSNSALGYGALYANTSGNYNSAFGQQALQANTTASNNTAVGYQAGYSNTTSNRQTFVGYKAGYATTGPNNTFIGYNAGTSTTSGYHNVAVGDSALSVNTTGAMNVAVGGSDDTVGYTLQNLTSGSYNVAVGNGASYANVSGNANTSVGWRALSSNTVTGNTSVGYQSGRDNTTGAIDAFGASSLLKNTTGFANCAFGNAALANNTTGSYNNAFGGSDNVTASTLGSNTTGGYNSAFGNGALVKNTSGSYNIAVGHNALGNNTTANYNTAVGYQASYSNTTGVNNTAIGVQAGYSNSTTNSNVFVGYGAGFTHATGQQSVYLGYLAGYYCNAANGTNTFLGAYAGYGYGGTMTGYSNTFVGYNAGGSITTGSNNTIIGSYSGNNGNLDIRTANNYIVLSDGSGRPALYSNDTYSGVWFLNAVNGAPYAGIINFTQNAVVKCQEYYEISSSRLYIQNSTAGVYLAQNGTSWTSASDERLKTDLVPIEDAANKVSLLRAVTGRFKTDPEDKRRAFLIAQDVQQALPEAVDATDPESIGVQYTDVIPLLVAAIKELNTEVQSLKAELAALKGN